MPLQSSSAGDKQQLVLLCWFSASLMRAVPLTALLQAGELPALPARMFQEDVYTQAKSKQLLGRCERSWEGQLEMFLAATVWLTPERPPGIAGTGGSLTQADEASALSA